MRLLDDGKPERAQKTSKRRRRRRFDVDAAAAVVVVRRACVYFPDGERSARSFVRLLARRARRSCAERDAFSENSAVDAYARV